MLKLKMEFGTSTLSTPENGAYFVQYPVVSGRSITGLDRRPRGSAAAGPGHRSRRRTATVSPLRYREERSCHPAIAVLTFPCFQQHRVGHDVLQLHVDAVWGRSAGLPVPCGGFGLSLSSLDTVHHLLRPPGRGGRVQLGARCSRTVLSG